MSLRNKILTIAGFDPSGGAGILADIKTFEAHRCYGFAVCTANTIQNESEFTSPNWVDEEAIFCQLELILKNHQFKYVKIGLIPSLDFLRKLIQKLSIVGSQIIWDPILSATAGFKFEYDLTNLEKELKQIFLITPNWNEVQQLSKKDNAQEGAAYLSQYTNVYLKGGHNKDKLGKDYLYYDGKIYPFNVKKISSYSKHGSGCVLSSSLAANMTLEYPIIKSCLRSKSYMSRFFNSSSTLLGNHKI